MRAEWRLPAIVFGLILSGLANCQQCIVDNCTSCENFTNITCKDCNSGYYLRTFSGGSKTYNACWKIWLLILIIVGIVAGSVMLCVCCYFAREKGKTDRRKPRYTQKTKQTILDKEPLAYQTSQGQRTQQDHYHDHL